MKTEFRMVGPRASEATLTGEVKFRVVRPREFREMVDVTAEKIPPGFMRMKFIVLATIDGNFAGACGIRGIMNNLSTEVSERFQGQGLGKKLLKRVILVAHERGEVLISSTALLDNYRSLGLTTRLGFFDIFDFKGHLGVERLTMIPLSTLGWFVVISLRAFRRIDSRILGRFFVTIQYLVSKT
jgi:GNAT superfamily N-acetyltransferase